MDGQSISNFRQGKCAVRVPAGEEVWWGAGDMLEEIMGSFPNEWKLSANSIIKFQALAM